MSRIAILGGGPAGCGAAYKLRAENKAEVVLFERNDRLGGNAGSFERGGHVLDYGSHRLHPSCAEEVMRDIESLLGADLLDRPRHGRIRLLGKWVHFPLKPVDLLFHLDKRFTIGTFRDMFRKVLPGRKDEGATFASVLEANLGPTICEHFYFPYARKIWGLEPEAMGAIQARRRVASGSFGKLIRKILGQVPGLRPKGAGRFFYPRGGFGQISEAYAARAAELGAEIRLATEVVGLERLPAGWRVRSRRDGEERVEDFDRLWSTIPLTILGRLMGEGLPDEVETALGSLDYRAMILVYLELDQERFTEFDAHYFPGAELTMTRMSEPKNYAVRTKPENRTVLCAEVPCDRGDELWNASDEELGRRIARDLALTELPLARPPVAVFSARLPQAYPIYQLGWEPWFEALDHWARSLPRFLSYGRQGLFAHDNTHHALAMAYAAVSCLDGEAFDEGRWAEYRDDFSHHVVED